MPAECSVTTIDLLRHGHCSWPPGFYGISDNPLSECGWEQMETTLSAVAPGYDLALTSPLSRCSGFAEHWAAVHGVECQQTELLVEGSLGVWEGRSVTDVENEDPQGLARFWAEPLRYPPKGAETLEALQLRMTRFVASILESHRGSNILMVTHSGLIRAYLMALLGCESSAWRTIMIAHGSLCRIKIYHQEGKDDWFQVERYGVTGY
ncbi:histidine phosphatase family protein [Aestuariirhabdus sp. LZHN29]|uniref:histidine phosphatase family protein n=1 Tax=Aestuariirhabdus sp. LZHN29 TaxID=3417462 RepID=UPI003CF81B1D